MSQILKPKKGYKQVKGLFGKYEEIPKEWITSKFSEHSKIVVGHVGSTSEHYRKKGILFLRTTNVTENKPDLTNVKFITKEFHEKLKKSQIKSGDILISRVGISGIACLIPETFPEANCANVLILKTKNTLTPKFLCYLLNSKNISRQVKAKEAGGVQSVINSQTFEKLLIHIPPLLEQQKIAIMLSNINNLILITQKIIDQTKSIKKGLMQKLLTKGIGHKKFKKVEWLFGKEIEIPEEWEIKKLDQISDVIDPYPSHRAPKETQTGVPYLGIGDFDENGNILKISRYVDEKIFEEQRKFFKLDPNDIAIGRVASIGKVIKLKYDTRFTISPTLSIIKSKNESNYLIQILKSYRFQRQLHYYTTGSTRSSVGIQIIRKLLVFLPPQQEQQKIATILSNVDSQIQAQTQYKEKLERLKKSLMQKLLTGQVRVTV